MENIKITLFFPENILSKYSGNKEDKYKELVKELET